MRKFLFILAAFAMLLLLGLPGCAGPGYYGQAISGHLRLMHKRQDLASAIDSDQLDTQAKQQLEQVLEIRKFAVGELNLPDNESYTEIVITGQDAVTWNVVAAGEFSVEPRTWCFPVAGCVSYRGYFSEEKARKFAGKLAGDGYDTDISPAAAYSTLGWFDDPLLDTMLKYGDEQLAGIIFHELAHQQLYVKDDSTFNEAYASFVEQAGVERWLQERGEEDRWQAWQAAQRASLDFNRLLAETRDDLEALYSSSLDTADMRIEKQQRLEQLHSDYQQQVLDQWDGQDYYGGWFKRELNNARLALMNSYEGGSCAFEKLFERANRDFETFHQLAAQQSRMDPPARSRWLEESCEVIAPAGNL